MTRKIGNSRRYEASPDGLQTMSALLILREKVIKPVLTGAGKPKHLSPVDVIYQTIHRAMRDLFETPGIAV